MKYNDKNQVQSGIDDSGDNQGIQRAAAVTDATQDWGTEIIKHDKWHAEKIDPQI